MDEKQQLLLLTIRLLVYAASVNLQYLPSKDIFLSLEH
jgi:hypothetical protein